MSRFQIVDIGVHHPDYFQGFGTSFTPFEHSTYGIGYTAQEAYADALDQLCDRDGINPDDLPKECPFSGSVEPRGDYCTEFYHVGIRWNDGAQANAEGREHE